MSTPIFRFEHLDIEDFFWNWLGLGQSTPIFFSAINTWTFSNCFAHKNLQIGAAEQFNRFYSFFWVFEDTDVKLVRNSDQSFGPIVRDSDQSFGIRTNRSDQSFGIRTNRSEFGPVVRTNRSEFGPIVRNSNQSFGPIVRDSYQSIEIRTNHYLPI